MGKFTSYRATPDQPYDPRVTDLSRPLIPPKPTNDQGGIDNYRNRNQRGTIPVQLVANVAQRILPNNLRRTGLIIQNKDTVASVFVGWGNSADSNAFALPAGAVVLEDFCCPASEVYLFATANVQAVVVETTRGY